MKLTQAHVRYWQQRQKPPKWVETVRSRRLQDDFVSIHEIVNLNGNVPQRTRGELQTHHTLNLVRSYIKRNVLREELQRLIVDPGTILSPNKRSSLARKWLKRLDKK